MALDLRARINDESELSTIRYSAKMVAVEMVVLAIVNVNHDAIDGDNNGHDRDNLSDSRSPR